jgi:hypothetical protein
MNLKATVDQLQARLGLRRSNAAQKHRNRKRELQRPGKGSPLTVLTNECGNQGNVYRTPLSITRTGDVPPTVVLTDPALFVAPAAPGPPTDGPH